MKTSLFIFVVSQFYVILAQPPIDLGRRSFPALPSLSPSSNDAGATFSHNTDTFAGALPPAPSIAPSVNTAEALAGRSATTEDATPEQLAAAAAHSSPGALSTSTNSSPLFYNPVSQPSSAPSAEGAPSLISPMPLSISSPNSSPSGTGRNDSPSNGLVLPNNRSTSISNSCNAGLAVSHQWTSANQSLPGTTFVVYLYLTGGSNSTEIPWTLRVQNNNYDNFLQWWNIDDVSVANQQLTATAKLPWESLDAGGSNIVDIGFIVQSVNLPLVDTSTDARTALFPSSVSINNQACSLYTI